MKYTVCTAICPIYKQPSAMAEYVDEAFFGQALKVIETNGEFMHIQTDYDYEGWAPAKCITDTPYEPSHIVTIAFGDLLYEPKNERRAAFDLPRGSRIKVLTDGGTERYAAVETTDGAIYYLHRKNIAPLAHISRERSEEQYRRDIADTAKLFLGTGYRWGGKTAAGIDCSGLAFMSYYMNGLHIYRDAHVDRSPSLRIITISEAKEGDLLFFPGHVAVYLGEGLYIHSTTALGGVGYNSLNQYSSVYNEGLKNSLKAVATVF